MAEAEIPVSCRMDFLQEAEDQVVFTIIQIITISVKKGIGSLLPTGHTTRESERNPDRE